MKVYQALARRIQARQTCERDGNLDWFLQHTDAAERLVKDCLPSGSGFDNGTALDLSRSTPERLVLHTSYHHMDEGGGYDGWTEHTVTVRPSLAFDFTTTVSGRDRNDIKGYIAETFDHCLSQEVPE